MDPCGAASVIDAPLMKNIKPAEKYGLPAIRMTTLGGFTPIYKDVGELHFVDDNGLCTVQALTRTQKLRPSMPRHFGILRRRLKLPNAHG